MTVVVSVNVIVDVVTDCIELSNHTVEVQPALRSFSATGNSDTYRVSGETLSAMLTFTKVGKHLQLTAQ